MVRILLLVVALFTVQLSFAQSCVPNQNLTEAGFFPKELDPATVDVQYKQVLQIRVFEDTTVLINGNKVVAIIDSINLLSIDGLPANFYYTCSRKNCSYIPDSTGCATLEGKAKSSDEGDHVLKIAIEIYAKIFGTVSTSQKDTVEQFTLVVIDPSSTNDVNNQTAYLYPNPGNGAASLSKILRSIEQVTCINSMGQSVPYSIENGQLIITDQIPGIYTVKIDFADGSSASERLIVKGN